MRPPILGMGDRVRDVQQNTCRRRQPAARHLLQDRLERRDHEGHQGQDHQGGEGQDDQRIERMDRLQALAVHGVRAQVRLDSGQSGGKLVEPLPRYEHRQGSGRTFRVAQADRLGQRVALHQPRLDPAEDARDSIVAARHGTIQGHRQRQVLAHDRAEGGEDEHDHHPPGHGRINDGRGDDRHDAQDEEQGQDEARPQVLEQRQHHRQQQQQCDRDQEMPGPPLAPLPGDLVPVGSGNGRQGNNHEQRRQDHVVRRVGHHCRIHQDHRTERGRHKGHRRPLVPQDHVDRQQDESREHYAIHTQPRYPTRVTISFRNPRRRSRGLLRRIDVPVGLHHNHRHMSLRGPLRSGASHRGRRSNLHPPGGRRLLRLARKDIRHRLSQPEPDRLVTTWIMGRNSARMAEPITPPTMTSSRGNRIIWRWACPTRAWSAYMAPRL